MLGRFAAMAWSPSGSYQHLPFGSIPTLRLPIVSASSSVTPLPVAVAGAGSFET